MKPALPLLLLCLALTGAAPPPADVAREVRTLPLDEALANKIYRVRTAPGLPAILQFPEGFASPPTCGDCMDGSLPQQQLKSSPALFVIQSFSAENDIAIKPARIAREEGGGDGPPRDKFLTTVTVRLVSKLTVTLQVEYARKEEADARIVFTLPQRPAENQYVRDQLRAGQARLDAEYAQRISENTTRVLLTELLEAPVCVEVKKHARRGDLRVDVAQLCRIGNMVFIRFIVENRGNTNLAVQAITVHRHEGSQKTRVERPQHVLTRNELKFHDVAKGVIGFEVAGEEAGVAWSLHVTERGDEGYETVVDRIGF